MRPNVKSQKYDEFGSVNDKDEILMEFRDKVNDLEKNVKRFKLTTG